MTPKQIVKNLSDDELKQSILEIKQWHKTGKLPDGIVRSVSKRIEQKANVPNHLSLRVTEDAILLKVADRFINMFNRV